MTLTASAKNGAGVEENGGEMEIRSIRIASNPISVLPKALRKTGSDTKWHDSKASVPEGNYTRRVSNKSLKCRGNGNPEIGCASQCAEHCRWVDIKSLVAGCAELTPEARQRMISIGDSSTENTLPNPIAKPFNEVQTDRNS